MPIIPGIMPITNYTQLARFSQMCGAEIPRWLAIRLEAIKDDPKAIFQMGQKFISDLCERLVRGGAPGLHFYTLNKAQPALDIALHCTKPLKVTQKKARSHIIQLNTL